MRWWIIKMHSKKYSSVLMQTIFCVKMHTVQRMIKTANKHRIFIFKIIDFKILNEVISIHKRSNFKIFCYLSIAFKTSGKKQGKKKKKKSTSNTAITYFFVLVNKKCFQIVSLSRKKSPQSREPMDNLILFSSLIWFSSLILNDKKLDRLEDVPNIYLSQQV